MQQCSTKQNLQNKKKTNANINITPGKTGDNSQPFIASVAWYTGMNGIPWFVKRRYGIPLYTSSQFFFSQQL